MAPTSYNRAILLSFFCWISKYNFCKSYNRAITRSFFSEFSSTQLKHLAPNLFIKSIEIFTLLSNCDQVLSNFNLALNKEPVILSKTRYFQQYSYAPPYDFWSNLMDSFWACFLASTTSQRLFDTIKKRFRTVFTEIIFLAIYRKEFVFSENPIFRVFVTLWDTRN